MSTELYAKMLCCTNNIPKTLLQKLPRMSADKMADELIAKPFREEGSNLYSRGKQTVSPV